MTIRAGRHATLRRAWTDRTLAGALVFSVLVTSYGYFGRFGSGNGNSRLSLVYAFVDDGTLTIDSYHDAPMTSTGDKSFNRGHYYSDKAIGTSVLGIIAYAPIRAGRAVSSTLWRVLTPFVRHWITFASVSLPVAAALTYLFLVLDSLVLARREALGVALLAGLATPLWPFATLYFGHALVAASLTVAFLMIMHRRHAESSWTFPARVCLGGLLGFSMITEFPAVPVVATLALYYLYDARQRNELALPQAWLLPVAGALPPLSLQLAYNAICFDSPFSLGYAHLADPHFRSIHARGLLGIGLPSPEVLYYITLHPVRGIFAHSPVLACGLVGLFLAIWQRRWRIEAITCLAITAIILLINAAFGVWWGGYSFAARHAIPAMPFLMVGLAFLPKRAWPIVAALSIISLVQMFVAVVGEPLTSDVELVRLMGSSLSSVAALGSPVWSQIWPGLFADPPQFSPNIGRLLGLRGFATLIPYCLAIAVLFLVYSLPGTRRRPLAQ